MSMTESKRESCEQILDALKYLFNSGKMDILNYYKGVISVASEFAKFDEMEDVVQLLCLIPGSFFTEELAAHLDADPLFMDVCYNLASELKSSGLVILAPEPVLTMPPAEA